MTKSDLRVIKTKKAIKTSFNSLLRVKDYSKITVKDISELALINRNTFYLHYQDKYDLMKNILDEHMMELNVCFRSVHYENIDTKSILLSITKETFRVLSENLEFFKIMIVDHPEIDFMAVLVTNLRKFITNGFEDNMTPDLKIKIDYMSFGLSGIICDWLVNSKTADLSLIISQVSELNYNVLGTSLP